MLLRDKIIFWILGIGLFAYLSYSISSVLFPFVAAFLISYFLNPLVRKIEKLKISRALSVSIVCACFVSCVTLFSLLIIPIIYHEFLNFINLVPGYFEVFKNETYPNIVSFLQKKGYKIDADLSQYISKDNLPEILGFLNHLVSNVMKSSVSIINIFSLIFITPILVFYLLKDWYLLVDNVNKSLPLKYAQKIRRIFFDIDKVLSGYLRGQISVCLILGMIYAFGLGFIGLNFGILIGFLTGFMSFVPYLGMLIGVIVAFVVALFQWGIDFAQIGYVALVFAVGQVVESNFLTPKLVGKRIGLHPVWVIFAVFAFGDIFGFLGVLLAVPMAAVIGVIVKFIIGEYKKSFVIEKSNKNNSNA